MRLSAETIEEFVELDLNSAMKSPFFVNSLFINFLQAKLNLLKSVATEKSFRLIDELRTKVRKKAGKYRNSSLSFTREKSKHVEKSLMSFPLFC